MPTQEDIKRKHIIDQSPALSALNLRLHDHQLPGLDSEHVMVTPEELSTIHDSMSRQVLLSSEFGSLSRCMISSLRMAVERREVVEALIAESHRHLSKSTAVNE